MIQTVCVFILLVFATSYFAPDFSRDEVARVASPSGRIDAVLVETNGGATTSFGYKVLLVPTGGKFSDGVEVASLYGAARNESAYDANPEWDGAQNLVVEYFTAKSEPSPKNTANIAGEQIQISLRSGIKDPSAPAGGMLYNLEQRKGK